MSRLVLVGAGPIGVAAADAAVSDGVVTAVFAVVDPDDEARRAAAQRFGAEGYESADALPPAREGDWALAAFSSRADANAPVILRLVALGYHVVTTCEELSAPEVPEREVVRSAAVSNGRRVIATGANPGFVMDRLVVAVASGARAVRRIDISRRVDTSRRRGPLVAKTGRGLTPEEFAARVAAGRLGHVGLEASAQLVARALGWPINDVNASIEPVVADDGTVAGLHQRAVLTTPEGGVLDFDLRMAWKVDKPGDAIHVHGSPELRVEIPGGYHGDEGTTAEVVNAIGRYKQTPPGFYSSIDLPLWFS